MKARIGQLESNLLGYAQMRKSDVIRRGDVCTPLEITPKQERELFSRMCRRGMLIRLIRGAYLVPMRMPLGGRFAASEYTILSKLMRISGARYQICGPNAFNIYGFSEQIPSRTYVFNDKFSGDRNIGGQQFVFIKCISGKLGAARVLKTGDGEQVLISTKERTIVDALNEWSRFATIPDVYGWIGTAIKEDPKFMGSLVKCAVKYAGQASLRRLGYCLDRTLGNEELISPLLKKIRLSRSYIPLVPGKPEKGGVDSKWGIIRNDGK
ncbi:MAG: hypothetical protein WAX69_04690 [Victivallales bacterium]